MAQVKRVRSRRGGFTLLEVLLVVGILALLAAFVVPTFIKTQEDAYVKTTKANMGGLTSPLELFHQALGRYPQELKELFEKPDDEEEASKWTGPYIDDLTKLKDAWGHEFQYLGNEDAKANEGRYDLWSMGKDGEDGTDDDITNWTKDGG
jgi:general secretion pathway protein G